MEAVIDAVRAALADDATPEARAAGVAACRAVLTALEPAPAPTAAAPTSDAARIANVVAALRGAGPEQLLDLAIARLRAALPPGTELPPANGIKFPFLRRG
jgi:hypothetical protein